MDRFFEAVGGFFEFVAAAVEVREDEEDFLAVLLLDAFQQEVEAVDGFWVVFYGDVGLGQAELGAVVV